MEITRTPPHSMPTKGRMYRPLIHRLSLCYKLPATKTSLTLDPPTRPFSLFNPSPATPTNRIFDSIRTPQDLDTLLLLTAASNQPLITLWTTSFCPTSASLKPLLHSLLCDERIGERKSTGLGFAEVQMDSSQLGDLVVRYGVSHVPTLLAFERQRVREGSRVVREEELGSGDFLRGWLDRQARRGGGVSG